MLEFVVAQRDESLAPIKVAVSKVAPTVPRTHENVEVSEVVGRGAQCVGGIESKYEQQRDDVEVDRLVTPPRANIDSPFCLTRDHVFPDRAGDQEREGIERQNVTLADVVVRAQSKQEEHQPERAHHQQVGGSAADSWTPSNKAASSRASSTVGHFSMIAAG